MGFFRWVTYVLRPWKIRRRKLASEIKFPLGETLGSFYDDNLPMLIQRFAKNLVDALVASEDVRYYEASGIDAKGVITRSLSFLGKRGGRK